MPRVGASGRLRTNARLAANRSAPASIRVPSWIRDFNLLLWHDYRTGKQGINSRSVKDMADRADVSYFGTTAIGTVYTNGEHSADLEDTAADYFKSAPVRLSPSPLTGLSVMQVIRRETVNGSYDTYAQWKATGSLRAWRLRVYNNAQNNALGFFHSQNGAAINEKRTTGPAIADNTTIHTIGAVFNGAATDVTLYVDGVPATSSYAAGAGQAVIFNPTVELTLGCSLDAAGNPVSSYDGKLFPSIAMNRVNSDAEMLALHNFFRQMIGF